MLSLLCIFIAGLGAGNGIRAVTGDHSRWLSWPRGDSLTSFVVCCGFMFTSMNLQHAPLLAMLIIALAWPFLGMNLLAAGLRREDRRAASAGS